jgi:DNA helicase HerA-like ATPase
MATNRLIGRVLATEKNPTTIDEFYFWTNSDTKLNAFDIVKVAREDGTDTYGVIESISHITDAASFLTNYISADFGNVDTIEPTYRIGMNYACAKVTFNTGEPSGDYTPVHNNSKVYLADESEIIKALGLDKVKNKLVCGSLKMYEGTTDEVTLPVCLDRTFLLGSEGAHLNISGISGLAAKTSYAMFLMKSIQDTYASMDDDSDDSVAFVLFNVKGRDLMAIDCPNDDVDERTLGEYAKLELTSSPFKQVKYYVPFSDGKSPKQSTYLSREDVASYIDAGKLKKFKYVYLEDKESIEMMFANVEDPSQTMEAIVSKIIDESDSDFGGLSDWRDFLEKVGENSQKGSSGSKGEISVLSWRKFKRIVNKAIKNDDMFANRVQPEQSECRLADALKRIKKNEVHVIDIAKLQEDKQAFVFGDAVKTIYNLKLGEYDNEGVSPPSRIVIFIDELNKYASGDAPKSSPILRQILDVTERGRSLGVVLFGAEQFRSAIHKRVTGNCATHAYGRTNSIETSTGEYRSLPDTYRNMLTRLSQGEYLIQNPVFYSLTYNMEKVV